MEGVVSFWGESCTNHVGRLACLTGPLEVHQSPPHRPHSALWAQEFSEEQKRGRERQECDFGQSEPF